MTTRQTVWLNHLTATGPRRRPRPTVLAWLVLLALSLAFEVAPAAALKAVPVNPDVDRIEITPIGELHEGRGDAFQIETATGPDGVPGRMAVRAASPGTAPIWIAFALTNPTDKVIERWLTAERYSLIGSGAIWPDLDTRRIEIVTPSLGFLPERLKSDRADIFRINLEPGQTVTFVAELATTRPTRMYLWKPVDYELKARDRQLFNGIMLGIASVLGIFLTAMFAANHKAIFPAAALVAWCVLGYLCVDFGFFHKLFNLRPEDNAVYRAATESAVAASLVIFLGTFLRLGAWHGFIRMLTTVWIVGQLALVALAVIDPRLAATFARTSFVAIGLVGALMTLFLALRGQDRALSLIPTWVLLLVFVFASFVTVNGRLQGDVVVSGLVAGLVLLVVLIGFTVIQFAFRMNDSLAPSAVGESNFSTAAIDGSGAAIWDWQSKRNLVSVGRGIEMALGLTAGELSTKVDDFLRHVHPADRDRLKLQLWSAEESGNGRLSAEFRLRGADNNYRTFSLDATSTAAAEGRGLRSIGLLRDITEAKRAHERLVHDAVTDNLTGLPNRELLMDRIGVVLQRIKADPSVTATVMFLDIDKFRSVNSSFGLVVGDSLLLTIARRMVNHLRPEDTLARVGGDQFGILILSESDPRELALLAERIRRSIHAPVKIVGQEIVLTGSIGIATADPASDRPHDLFKNAEIAMHRAKHQGADQIVMFEPNMRGEVDDRVVLESDLRQALEKRQLKVFYQPIVYLPTEELAGLEALVRWDHPKLGRLNPADFISVAEQSDLINRIGAYVLERAAENLSRWQTEYPRGDRPLFVSVNISSRQLLRPDLVPDVRQAITRHSLPQGSLRLELTETLVMENPEQSSEVLALLKAAGASLAIDDFGTGYSSLAYLQRFPFDALKIDRALIEGCTTDPAGATIVRSIVAMTHELGKKVVAEGVEGEEEAAFLRSIRCEYAQGYHFGEPMPERDVLALLRTVRKTERKLQSRGFFRTKTAAPEKKAKPSKPKPGGGDPTPTNGADGAPAPPPPSPSGGDPRTRAPTSLPASQVRRQRPRPEPSEQQPLAPQPPMQQPQQPHMQQPQPQQPMRGPAPPAANANWPAAPLPVPQPQPQSQPPLPVALVAAPLPVVAPPPAAPPPPNGAYPANDYETIAQAPPRPLPIAPETANLPPLPFLPVVIPPADPQRETQNAPLDSTLAPIQPLPFAPDSEPTPLPNGRYEPIQLIPPAPPPPPAPQPPSAIVQTVRTRPTMPPLTPISSSKPTEEVKLDNLPPAIARSLAKLAGKKS